VAIIRVVLRAFTPVTCLLLALMTFGCGSSSPEEEGPRPEDIKGLITQDVKVGDGAEATFGNEVLVHYTGWIYDEKRGQKRGREFDSSRDRNEPHAFKLGAGEVIRGWDEGVAGMKVGGRRTLTIPPEMAYGDKGLGELIPPNAILIFDVELIEVK
jgi:FKBP-type peptidyl-prolyl cis-trans isomerase